MRQSINLRTVSPWRRQVRYHAAASASSVGAVGIDVQRARSRRRECRCRSSRHRVARGHLGVEQRRDARADPTAVSGGIPPTPTYRRGSRHSRPPHGVEVAVPAGSAPATGIVDVRRLCGQQPQGEVHRRTLRARVVPAPDHGTRRLVDVDGGASHTPSIHHRSTVAGSYKFVTTREIADGWGLLVAVFRCGGKEALRHRFGSGALTGTSPGTGTGLLERSGPVRRTGGRDSRTSAQLGRAQSRRSRFPPRGRSCDAPAAGRLA